MPGVWSRAAAGFSDCVRLLGDLNSIGGMLLFASEYREVVVRGTSIRLSEWLALVGCLISIMARTSSKYSLTWTYRSGTHVCLSTLKAIELFRCGANWGPSARLAPNLAAASKHTRVHGNSIHDVVGTFSVRSETANIAQVVFASSSSTCGGSWSHVFIFGARTWFARSADAWYWPVSDLRVARCSEQCSTPELGGALSSVLHESRRIKSRRIWISATDLSLGLRAGVCSRPQQQHAKGMNHAFVFSGQLLPPAFSSSPGW